MKAIVLAIILAMCLSPDRLFAQQYFADYLIAGSSLTYMQNTSREANQYLYGYIEWTWNVNLGMRLSKRAVGGIHLLNIYSSEIYKRKDYYNLYGVFLQYNLLPKKEPKRLFIEASFNQSNYCLCGELPSYHDKLPYLGVGGGFDWQIKKIKNLSLDLSFISYFNLKEFEEKNAYTQYVVGLNYRLGGVN